MTSARTRSGGVRSAEARAASLSDTVSTVQRWPRMSRRYWRMSVLSSTTSTRVEAWGPTLASATEVLEIDGRQSPARRSGDPLLDLLHECLGHSAMPAVRRKRPDVLVAAGGRCQMADGQ